MCLYRLCTYLTFLIADSMVQARSHNTDDKSSQSREPCLFWPAQLLASTSLGSTPDLHCQVQLGVWPPSLHCQSCSLPKLPAPAQFPSFAIMVDAIATISEAAKLRLGKMDLALLPWQSSQANGKAAAILTTQLDDYGCQKEENEAKITEGIFS